MLEEAVSNNGNKTYLRILSQYRLLAGIQKMMKEGKDADVLLSSGKSRGANWLVGRQGGRSTSTPALVVEQLTAKITRKVTEKMSLFLKKLGEVNSDLKFDIGDICDTVSSDEEKNGILITPITRGGTSF